jgi:hypothetical protein
MNLKSKRKCLAKKYNRNNYLNKKYFLSIPAKCLNKIPNKKTRAAIQELESEKGIQ